MPIIGLVFLSIDEVPTNEVLTINGVAVEGVVVEWDWIVVLSLEIMYNNIVRWLEICNNQTLF